MKVFKDFNENIHVVGIPKGMRLIGKCKTCKFAILYPAKMVQCSYPKRVYINLPSTYGCIYWKEKK